MPTFGSGLGSVLPLTMCVALQIVEWTSQTNKDTQTSNDMMINFSVHEWKMQFWKLSVINNNIQPKTAPW